MLHLRNSYSKLESPLLWDCQNDNPCLVAHPRDDSTFDTTCNDPTLVRTSGVVSMMQGVDAGFLDAGEMDFPTIDDCSIFFRPELSLIRSVCAERKIPAKCLRLSK